MTPDSATPITLSLTDVEGLLRLLNWLGDHGGGERVHQLVEGERCPSCDANAYAEELAHQLSARNAGHRCGSDITLRDEEHALVCCEKRADHTDAHAGTWGDDNRVEWTDATHY